ncbi:MAG TPA: TfoX/Sxy family protein [Microlunatus sp.]
MSPQHELIERLRARLATEPSLREVSMFGGNSFMINDKIVVSALKEGDLLVRVDARHHAELMARPGAQQAQMGSGRTMGPGWIAVDAASMRTEADLSCWLEAALAHNRSAADRT